MSYIFFNPNPCGRAVGDCSVRAVAKALDLTWNDAFLKRKAAAAVAGMPQVLSGPAEGQHGVIGAFCQGRGFLDHRKAKMG